MFLNKYLSPLAGHPVATTVTSVAVLLLSLHILIPVVIGIGNFFKRFWSRGKIGISNWYINKWDLNIQGWKLYTNMYRLVEKEDGWVYSSIAGDTGVRFYDHLSPDDVPIILATFFKTEEEALAAKRGHPWRPTTVCRNLYIKMLMVLLAAVTTPLFIGMFVDYLLFSHLQLTLTVLAISAMIWVSLYGGRYVYEMKEKLDSIIPEVKEKVEEND